jgi:hypothetical protein
MELIAKFDPFLKEHLNNYGNVGSGKTNCISLYTVRETIILMIDKVLKHIIEEIKNSTYFGMIVDSTPDITHIDQLAIVLRYVNCDGQPVERFVKFQDIYGYTAEYLTITIVEIIKKFGIDIKNCVGQSYDNASNMAGKYSGLQTRIRTLAPLAIFLPCAAHSLNLVGVHAVENCNGAVEYFSIIQFVYNFFLSSTHRWKLLYQHLECNETLTIKSSSQTRLSANADATKALQQNYAYILSILLEISQDNNENGNTQFDAMNILKTLKKRETAILTIVWDVILQRINITSKSLQSSTENLFSIVPLYNSLTDFIQYVREYFGDYESKSIELLNKDI